MPRFREIALAVVFTLAAASAARAQVDLFSPATVSGLLDLRLAATDADERSFLDGGFGKGRFGDGFTVTAAEAGLAWRPRLSEQVSALVTVQAQPGADPAVDVGEAYVSMRPTPLGRFTVAGRAGLYWPTLSLEHDGLLWTTPDTITPSAVNTWVAEELKLIGAEVTVAADIGSAGTLAATAGVFGWGDTAGTLLSFRGWALHDVKNGLSSRAPLPPLSPYIRVRQAPYTTALLELDDRAGAYGRLEWRPRPDVTLDVFVYDNAGDRISVDAAKEWAWDTRFVAAGLDLRSVGGVHLRAQAMSGVTLMGRTHATLNEIWVDVDYAAAYVSATRAIGPGAITARLDLFETGDRSLRTLDDNTERGSAQTVAWRWDVKPGASLLFEVLRIDSDRPARALAADRPRQVQTTAQAALRLEF